MAKRHMEALEKEKEDNEKSYKKKMLRFIKFGKRGFKRKNAMREDWPPAKRNKKK